MSPIRIKLVFFAFLLMIVMSAYPARLAGAEDTTVGGILLSEGEIDTSYQIKKLITARNTGLAEETQRENYDDLSKIAAKLKCDAVIFITNASPRNDPDAMVSNGIAVQYLSPQEAEKRAQKAKKPPVLKKESKLDPEPVTIEYKDVKFPYRILGILDLRTPMDETNYSAQAMNYRMADVATREGADGVIFIDYIRSGNDVSGGLGIMIKSYDTWDLANADRKKDFEIKKIREERRAKQAQDSTAASGEQPVTE
jgi:uncharacterized protein YbjQ (UPF0145 family)